MKGYSHSYTGKKGKSGGASEAPVSHGVKSSGGSVERNLNVPKPPQDATLQGDKLKAGA